MSAWDGVLNRLGSTLEALSREGVADPWFRGHREGWWRLEPSLARVGAGLSTESRLYYSFQSMGGHLIPPNLSSWEILFLMQHHGIPTRLLDWTESFAAALRFAVQNATSDAAVWILDPYHLNRLSSRSDTVDYLDSAYPLSYEEAFLNATPSDPPSFPAEVLAVGCTRPGRRMQSQRGVFTLHRNLVLPLDLAFSDCLTKVVIPTAAFEGARRFLRLAGVSEYSLFPDLDGLGRHLRDEELGI
jgi:hypothetical protein